MEIDFGPDACSAIRTDRTTQLQNGAEAYGQILGELAANPALAAAVTREIEVGLLGDYDFSVRQGANSEDELLARFNIVDGIFMSQVGLRITPAS